MTIRSLALYQSEVARGLLTFEHDYTSLCRFNTAYLPDAPQTTIISDLDLPAFFMGESRVGPRMMEITLPQFYRGMTNIIDCGTNE